MQCGCWILALLTLAWGQANAQATSARAIYRCEIEGVLTFSDRPCDPDAQVHELDGSALNVFDPPATSAASPRAASKAKASKRSTGNVANRDAQKQKQTCDRLAQALKDVRARQRTGYRGSEGERLRDRESKLKSELRLARYR
jgi:hypothetical protein